MHPFEIYHAPLDQPPPEIGWPDMKIIKSDKLLGDEGEIINGFILHFDEVFGLSEEKGEVILTSSECENLVFKLKGYPVWGIQPHLEIGIVQAFAVLELIRGPAVQDKSCFICSDQRRPRDTDHIIRVMKAFQKTNPLLAKIGGSCCF